MNLSRLRLWIFFGINHLSTVKIFVDFISPTLSVNPINAVELQTNQANAVKTKRILLTINRRPRSDLSEGIMNEKE